MGIDLGRFKPKKNDEWMEWLADDPVPTSIRNKMRTKAVQDAARQTARRPGATAKPQAEQARSAKQSAISIHISIPKVKFRKPDISIPPQLMARKRWLVGGAFGLVLVVGVAGSLAISGGRSNQDQDAPAVLSENDQKANFAYSLPKGDTDAIDGDVRYDSQRKVVNFKDSIGGVDITISQQPLPEDFGTDTESKVKKLAEGFSADRALTTANPTAYIGKSVEGPQTVIFSKKDLLVFIFSVKEIDDHDWAEYITNLQ